MTEGGKRVSPECRCGGHRKGCVQYSVALNR